MNRWHWPVALVAAASLHLAVAAVAPLGTPQLPGAQALGEGEGGFEIGLGYLGGFADRLETAPDVELVEPEVPEPEVAQESEAVTEPAPVEEVVEPEPEPTPIPVQVAVAPPAPKPPQPKPDPKPTPPKPAAPPPAEPIAAPAPATTAKAEGPAQAAMVAGTGSGRERRAGGRSGGGARSYYSDLMAALNRHKTYPPELKKRKTQGTVMVAFAIGAAGDLLRAQVTQSSGHPELDAAALAMLHNAAPLPPIPREFSRAELSVELPVEYSLITD